MDEKVKERIKFNTEIIKLFALLFMAAGGGTVSLIVNQLPGSADGFFAALGMVIVIASCITCLIIVRDTSNLLNK